MSLGVFVTGGNKPYLSLRRSFLGKTLKTIVRPDKYHPSEIGISLFFRVRGIFAESRWRELWRRLGVPVFVRGKGKKREMPISEG